MLAGFPAPGGIGGFKRSPRGRSNVRLTQNFCHLIYNIPGDPGVFEHPNTKAIFPGPNRTTASKTPAPAQNVSSRDLKIHSLHHVKPAIDDLMKSVDLQSGGSSVGRCLPQLIVYGSGPPTDRAYAILTRRSVVESSFSHFGRRSIRFRLCEVREV